jgi:hypothetical protein
MSPGRALEKPHYDKQSGNKDHFLFHALLEVDPIGKARSKENPQSNKPRRKEPG